MSAMHSVGRSSLTAAGTRAHLAKVTSLVEEKEKPPTGLAEGYIHGFDHEEQDRLYKQARVYEDIIFSQVNLSRARDIVEIGSGVGAQTMIINERYPNAHIECVDASIEQVQRARSTLKPLIDEGTVKIHQADALHLPLQDTAFDGAYISWLLEHVQNPVGILEEARRVLRPGGIIYANEVFHSTFHVHPYAPATMKYWNEFCGHQSSLKGDPYVGGKLGNYLLEAGYQNITTQVLLHEYDNRSSSHRADFIDHWIDLLKSGAEALVKVGRVDWALVDNMTAELEAMKTNPESVIFYAWILARAEAPGRQRRIPPPINIKPQRVSVNERYKENHTRHPLSPVGLDTNPLPGGVAEESSDRWTYPLSPMPISPAFAKVEV